MSEKNKMVYSSYIKDMPFLFLEMRKAAKLIADGTGLDSIVPLSIEKNIFQLDKERRRLKLAQKVVLRMSVLSNEQIMALAGEQDETAKLVAFYAVIKTDLLFFEFMIDVYMENLRIGQHKIADTDIIAFLRSKEEIQMWTDNNFVRVKNTYKKILCEAGLCIREDSFLIIQKPILGELLEKAFPNGDEYTAAMGLEV